MSNEFVIKWSTLRRLHWGRAVAGGVCAELAVCAIVFPVLHFFGQIAFLLHVSVVAALVYLIVAWGQPEPFLYKVGHGLKLVGGLLGGVTSARRMTEYRV